LQLFKGGRGGKTKREKALGRNQKVAEQKGCHRDHEFSRKETKKKTKNKKGGKEEKKI